MRLVKPWYLSTGVWGAAVSVAGSGAALLHALPRARPGPGLPPSLRDLAPSLAAFAGGAVALYGRLRATRRVVAFAPRPDPAVARQNWRMNAAALALLLPAALACCPGCSTVGGALSSPSAAYLAADRATYDAVAPEYADYVRNDASLDEAQRARRERTLETWKLRVQATDAPAATLPGTTTPAAITPLATVPEKTLPSDPGMPERELTPDREVTGDE